MKVELVTQYSVFMANRPGSLARLAQLFADQGINLVGIASEVRDDTGMVRVAVPGHQNHSAVLSRSGFASVETKLLSVEVDDKPGQLQRITQILAEGGVNITTVYGTSLGNRSRILIAADKTDKALALLQQTAP